MVVAKRLGKEKPPKIEQRKGQRPEWGPQVDQTALLASPIYIGQAQGEEKTYKKRSDRARVLSLLFVSLGRHALMPWGCIFLLFSIKLSCNAHLRAITWSVQERRAITWYVQELWRAEAFNVRCFKLWWEPRRLHSPDRNIFSPQSGLFLYRISKFGWVPICRGEVLLDSTLNRFIGN